MVQSKTHLALGWQSRTLHSVLEVLQRKVCVYWGTECDTINVTSTFQTQGGHSLIGWMAAKIENPLQREALLQRWAKALKLRLPLRRPPLYLSGLSGTSAVFFSVEFPFLPTPAVVGGNASSWRGVPPPSHRQPANKPEPGREGVLLHWDFTHLGIWAKASANRKMFLYLILPSVYMGQELGVRMLSPHRIPFSISILVSE